MVFCVLCCVPRPRLEDPSVCCVALVVILRVVLLVILFVKPVVWLAVVVPVACAGHLPFSQALIPALYLTASGLTSLRSIASKTSNASPGAFSQALTKA